MPSKSPAFPPKPISPQESKKFDGYKAVAYEEYVAARTLFNTGQLRQACILANTAIERELKAYLLYFNKPSTSHDIHDLYNKAIRIAPELQSAVNSDFIKAIAKIYKSRYHENLSPGYNFIIIQNRFLAELDQTYDILEGMSYSETLDKNNNALRRKNHYQDNATAKNIELWRNNFILNKIPKAEFLSKQDYVLEFRMTDELVILTATYSIPYNPDNLFIQQAIKMIPIPVGQDGVKSHTLVAVYTDFLNQIENSK